MKNHDEIQKWIIDYLESGGMSFKGATCDTHKNNMCMDSLDDVEFIMSLEEEFGIKIKDEEAEKINTIGQSVELVESKLKEDK